VKLKYTRMLTAFSWRNGRGQIRNDVNQWRKTIRVKAAFCL
jgi:hypothetical protein